MTCHEPQRRGDGVPDSFGRPGHCAAVTHHNYGGGVGHYETPHATSDVGDTVTDNSFGLGGQNVAVAFGAY